MAERMSTATRMDRNRADGIIRRGEKSAAKRVARNNREMANYEQDIVRVPDLRG